MRYPEFLKKHDTIAHVAPSFGVTGEPYTTQYKEARRKFEELGYTIQEAESLYLMGKAASNTAEARASEWMKAYLDENVDFVHSVAGGELMMEILPLIDFHTLIHAKPKWFMGYSDNTYMTFLLNTICDTASLYGNCVENFGMEKWHKSLKESYQIMQGKRFEQKSYPKFAINDVSHIEGMELADYDLTEKNVIYTSTGEDMTLHGRLLGGCMDCLVTLVGTPYDQVEEFKERYSEDGVLFYMEAYDYSPVGIVRTLLQMKEAGWFDGCNGILFGRRKQRDPFFGLTYEEALHSVLDDLNTPYVYEMDFGHVPPAWTLISGSVATVEVKNRKASITYELK